jgi:hypothetical protein
MTPPISHITERIKKDQAELGITLYPGATVKDITLFEALFNCKLPEEIKTFYAFCNGFESEEDWFRIIPLDEIIETGRDEHLANPADFHIAEYMTYCDMWTLSIDPQDSNRYTIYNQAKDIVTLTNSFAVFLEVFINKGVFDGLYDWRDALIKNSH